MPEQRIPRGWLGIALGDQSAFKRLLFLLLVLSIGLFVVVLWAWIEVRGVVRESSSVEVSVSEEGAIRFRSGGETTAAVYTLHASQMWADTGIVIAPHDAACVTASGRVNLAVHRLVDAAVSDVPPLSSWTDPAGEVQAGTPSSSRRRDADRDELLILPTAPLGSLLAHLSAQNVPAPGPVNPRGSQGDASSVLLVGNRNTVRNDTDQPMVLYLTVNDAFLDASEDTRRRYLGRESDPGYEKRAERWDPIVANRYWNLWFDDNVGSFVVQVRPGTSCQAVGSGPG